MKLVDGFADDEQALARRLEQVLVRKSTRNLLRSAYMDGKHALHRLPATSPPYLRELAIVLGWPAKAVELLARRIRLEGFALPDGGELSEWGLDSILRDNRYMAESGQGRVSALAHSVAFEVVTRGHEGEPDAIISRVTAMDGTGDWNPRTRRLDTFLWVQERDEKEITAFTLFYGDQIVAVRDGKVVGRGVSTPGCPPVAPLPYKPRLDRPFGSSRISRPVMSITDSAVRTIIRSEGTADFYGAPWFMIFGPGEDAFSKNSWQMLFDRINAIPDNTDPDITNQRADVKQFTQASQAPHVDQLQVWAGLFAGETNIPVSSLGVGMSQANPTSSESYHASREDLIAEAEDAQDQWSNAHAQSVLWAWQIANGEKTVPAELAGLEPIWRDARHLTRAASADATLKNVQAFPWMAESDAVVETLGLDRSMTQRLLADKRRAGGGSVLAQLQALAPSDESSNTTALDDVNVLKAKLEALGIGVRAGATFESLRAALGLDGVESSGAIPVGMKTEG